MSRLMIIADLEGKGHATPRGLELAHKLGLRTDVVAFVYAPLKRLKIPRGQQAGIKKRLLEERRSVVQSRIDRDRRPGQKINLKVVWEKDITKWVCRACKENSYIAVVKTGHRSDTLLHTSTDWQLLRDCPAPVLIVAASKWHRTRPVLVSLDLGTELPSKQALNHKLLESATTLANALGVEREIVGAVEVPTLMSDLDLVDPAAYVKQAREAMRPHIRELASAHGLPESAFQCRRGPVEKVITSHAAKVKAQIVVMGTVGRKGVSARLLGNTAEKVLRHMRTDVLAIKP